MAIIEPKIEESWKKLLAGEFQQPYFSKLKDFLVEEKRKYSVFPPGDRIFSAFDLTPFDKVKVVILGQDPYHGRGQAHGLCFSVNPGIPFPPSLVNIFKELQSDLGIKPPISGELSAWAHQGVLLLNTVLTVRENTADSHKNKGWEQFTDSVIRYISAEKENVVFILWGNNAKVKTQLIDTAKHCILTAAHPSPLSASRGFFGCRHFSRANEYLVSKNIEPIDWQL
ncbi:Uracil-DNA glycosylase [bioreactor metagenome]|uniref:uracil-DNA glycosylase n=1 Tax=bioreactor metagenome TaxID=1076179 RepID=A0A644W5W7_9ZZZZ